MSFEIELFGVELGLKSMVKNLETGHYLDPDDRQQLLTALRQALVIISEIRAKHQQAADRQIADMLHTNFGLPLQEIPIPDSIKFSHKEGIISGVSQAELDKIIRTKFGSMISKKYGHSDTD